MNSNLTSPELDRDSADIGKVFWYVVFWALSEDLLNKAKWNGN